MLVASDSCNAFGFCSFIKAFLGCTNGIINENIGLWSIMKSM